MDRSKSNRWDRVSVYWKFQEEPLSPSSEDLRIIDRAVEAWFERSKRPARVLILGVTPQFFRIKWPKGTKIIAIDHSEAMIERVWPGKKKDAILGDWRSMTLADHSIDIALCDGGFIFLDYPAGQRSVVDQLARVIAIDGVFVGRFYLPPKRKEKTNKVLADFRSGNIKNVANLKVRLWMSLRRTSKDGVVLQDIWNMLKYYCPDFERIAKKLEWKIETLATLRQYRNNKERFYFPRLYQVERLFVAARVFRVLSRVQPPYHMGEQYPTIIIQRV
jgi:SAM-dependent methyltransferase